MSELLTGLLEVVKLAPRYLAPIGIVAAVLLLVPEQYLELLGVAQLAKDYRPVIGMTLLFAGAVMCLALGSWVSRWIRAWRGRKRAFRQLLEHLEALTEDEKQILRFYIAKQTRTNRLRFDDGVVQGLVAKRILFRSSSAGNWVEGFDHNITQRAWEHLQENQALLDGTTNSYRTDRRAEWY